MNKLLYFTCPTDRLEPVINNTFKQENYYYTSLGNSTPFDDDLLKQLKKIIVTKEINKISFVLSNDNKILADALGSQNYSTIKGLNNFYYQIKMYKENAKALWRGRYNQLLILSYHLNNKINELKCGLNDVLTEELLINGEIYNRQKNVFCNIHSELLCLGYESFN